MTALPFYFLTIRKERNMENEMENLDNRIPVRCSWCGWCGTLADLDMNEHDAPAYCPECGCGSLTICPREKRED